MSALVAFALVFPDARASAQGIEALRADQLVRLQNYVLDATQPNGLVRDSLVLDPAASHFHPATPDAAGFALVALSAFDHLGSLPDAENQVLNILRAHAGLNAGVTPGRSADGHFVHFMNIATGAVQGGGWDDSYSPISSALLVSGAQFAANHFPANGEIRAITEQLTSSIDFNAAIHPALDGRIFLDQTLQGGGSGGAVRPWNEYMLVQSLALRQRDNGRAVAVRHHWLNTGNIAKSGFAGHQTLTDSPGTFAPAFWTQHQQFLNGDFRHRDEFQSFLESHQLADQAYSSAVLDEPFRYGLTAGVTPNGYHADRINDHPFEIFSPEAVAAWGDLDSLLQFYEEQSPDSDPRYRYGLVRVSDEQPDWVPNDAGLVDHLLLLFGLVESVAPDFFADRLFAPLLDGDYNFDGVVDAADFTVWQDTVGSVVDLRADGSLNGSVGPEDFVIWESNFGATSDQGGLFFTVPEPGFCRFLILLSGLALLRKASRESTGR